MTTPFRIQRASGEQSSHKESEFGGGDVAHLPRPSPEPVLPSLSHELPFELVERILWFLIEIPGMATIVARVGRFSYRRAVRKIYNAITITCDTRHEILASALKGNRCLRPLVKSIVIDIGRESRNCERRTMNVKTILKAVASNLEDLHIIRNYDTNYRLGYIAPNLRSLILFGTKRRPSTRTSWTKLTHVIADRPNQIRSFSAQRFPLLTHIATVPWSIHGATWVFDYRPSIAWLSKRESASLRFSSLSLSPGRRRVPSLIWLLSCQITSN
ncbi:hypothetical protein JAAARDRAFT_60707 [Jaapia argillacea MUCL 33604]|uniref:F-box domain-containing protein n=1 Tax=Jaapia argillacea MUCL 33604 TaxID=933084 RepID=A0A067PHL5_9AGAM|nr:hypothetical protein JAAARDRAFT_60707 [Jaapia argillacea MUCL 33604]